MRILFFGDSITQGLTDPTGGWVQRQLLGDAADSAPDCFNLGVSADTSQNVCDRFEFETQARKRSHKLVFVFAVGVNDACIAHGTLQATPDQYRENITRLIAMARKFSDKIMFVGLTPCQEDKTVPCVWGDYVYKNEDINKLEVVLQDVCQAKSVPLVSVADSFVGKEKELLADGLHPNTKGHELIANLVKPELEKLIA